MDIVTCGVYFSKDSGPWIFVRLRVHFMKASSGFFSGTSCFVLFFHFMLIGLTVLLNTDVFCLLLCFYSSATRINVSLFEFLSSDVERS